jgi:DNA-binding XRE family transcriptional regulator
LENGTRKNPSIEVMEKIAKALDTNIFEIFFNGE